jgi:hypothetical protein
MAPIEKPLNPPSVVPAGLSTEVGAPPSLPPTGTASAPVLPDLNRFNAITGGRTGAPRSILTRAAVGYNGPHEVGGVRFASTDAAMDQILVENGAEKNVPLLRRAYEEIA